MTTPCSHYRANIPKAVIGDLSPEDQRDLDLHLAECRPCNRESLLYADTIRQLGALQDEAVPRHFFVYHEDVRLKPWQSFVQMSRAWQVAAAALMVGLGLLGSMAIAKLSLRTENGSLILSFGEGPVVADPHVRIQQADTRELEERILKTVAERNALEKLELVRTLRNETARDTAALTREQQAILGQALTNLEVRMSQAVAASTASLENRMGQSMQELYRAVSLDRQRDMAAIDNRINVLAASGEIKNNQTDEILATLLQVAELRTR